MPDDYIINGRLTDRCTNAATTIAYSHHEIHSGSYYRSGMNFTLANGQVATFSITTPKTKEVHVQWDLSATADGTFSLTEDVTIFSGGVAITPINHNRIYADIKPSLSTCLRGMTGSNLITETGGAVILSAALATGKGQTMSRAAGEEFIFKKDSKYLFKYTNGTSANVIQLACEWYEHERRTSFGT